MDKDVYKDKVIEIKRELHSYGISKVELPGLPLEYWVDIKTTCAVVHNEFPEIFKIGYIVLVLRKWMGQILHM